MRWTIITALATLAVLWGLSSCGSSPSVEPTADASTVENVADAPPKCSHGHPCEEGFFCCDPAARWAKNCSAGTCVKRPVLSKKDWPPCVGFGRCDTTSECDPWADCMLDVCSVGRPLPKKGYCWRPGCYSNADCASGESCYDHLCRKK